MIYLLNKNNMKKLAYIATIACSMFLTTSCVDLTQEPQSFITDEDYIASMDLTGLQQAATGLYNDLWNGNYGFNCRLQRINVCADDITYRAAKANNELANYYRLSPNITANTADFDTTWSLFFAVINHSNTLINKTVLPENADQAKKFEEVLGEAYFLRGLSYFYLVRMYGDVPLILAETDASTYMPRTAVAEIYDQAIIPSLKKAVEILPAKSRSGRRYGEQGFDAIHLLNLHTLVQQVFRLRCEIFCQAFRIGSRDNDWFVHTPFGRQCNDEGIKIILVCSKCLYIGIHNVVRHQRSDFGLQSIHSLTGKQL